MIKTNNQQSPVIIPTLTFKPPPSAPSLNHPNSQLSNTLNNATGTLINNTIPHIPHYSHKKPFHKDCFSFNGVVYYDALVSNNSSETTTNENDVKYKEMVKQLTNLDNREFFEQFLFKKNRRGLFNCLSEMEKIKNQLMDNQPVSLVKIYAKIIRKYLISVVDVRNNNIDTILSSSEKSLLGISRAVQRKSCELFENLVRVNELTELWNELFVIVEEKEVVEMTPSTQDATTSTNQQQAHHERGSSISHFFRRFSVRPPKHSTNNDQVNQLKEEAKVTPRKRANSMSFGFKKLTDDQVKHLNQVYNVRERESLKFTMENFKDIFQSLHSEIVKQLKILFDQYVEDSDEFEMFLMERVQKRNPNDFPELFNKPSGKTTSSSSLLNVSPNARSPSPNSSSLVREHSFPSSTTSSNGDNENISTSESMSPASPNGDHSPLNDQHPFKSKLSIPLQHVKRQSSDFEIDGSETLISPRKLKNFFSVEEKKKKKMVKQQTEKKVQTIQDQMNKYNKIISSLYKDLIEREGEIQQLRMQLSQLESESSSPLDDEEVVVEEYQLQEGELSHFDEHSAVEVESIEEDE